MENYTRKQLKERWEKAKAGHLGGKDIPSMDFQEVPEQENN
jgi:hypothetical protein